MAVRNTCPSTIKALQQSLKLKSTLFYEKKNDGEYEVVPDQSILQWLSGHHITTNGQSTLELRITEQSKTSMCQQESVDPNGQKFVIKMSVDAQNDTVMDGRGAFNIAPVYTEAIHVIENSRAHHVLPESCAVEDFVAVSGSTRFTCAPFSFTFPGTPSDASSIQPPLPLPSPVPSLSPSSQSKCGLDCQLYNDGKRSANTAHTPYCNTPYSSSEDAYGDCDKDDDSELCHILKSPKASASSSPSGRPSLSSPTHNPPSLVADAAPSSAPERYISTTDVVDSGSLAILPQALILQEQAIAVVEVLREQMHCVCDDALGWILNYSVLRDHQNPLAVPPSTDTRDTPFNKTPKLPHHN